jgi:hypothetical protein
MLGRRCGETCSPGQAGARPTEFGINPRGGRTSRNDESVAPPLATLTPSVAMDISDTCPRRALVYEHNPTRKAVQDWPMA